MGIEQRLTKAERAMGGRRGCTCPNPMRVYYSHAILPGQSDVRPPDVCEVCGGETQILEIVYVDDWRRFSHAD